MVRIKNMVGSGDEFKLEVAAMKTKIYSTHKSGCECPACTFNNENWQTVDFHPVDCNCDECTAKAELLKAYDAGDDPFDKQFWDRFMAGFFEGARV